MRLVHKNRTGQPWDKRGHDVEGASIIAGGCIYGFSCSIEKLIDIQDPAGT